MRVKREESVRSRNGEPSRSQLRVEVSRESACIGGVELAPLPQDGEVWATSPRWQEFTPYAPDLLQRFAALAGVPPEERPLAYSQFFAQNGPLPCVLTPDHLNTPMESLLLWRWHAERVAYLLKFLAIWRAATRDLWVDAAVLLTSAFDVTVDLLPNPETWTYPPESSMNEVPIHVPEEQRMVWRELSTNDDRDEIADCAPVHVFSPLISTVSAVTWGATSQPFHFAARRRVTLPTQTHPDPAHYLLWRTMPMEVDMPLVYHPFHEGAMPLAFLAGGRLVNRSGRRTLHLHERAIPFLRSVDPKRYPHRHDNWLTEREILGHLGRGLGDAIATVADRYWGVRLEDPVRGKVEFTPKGLLGSVYWQLTRSIAAADPRAARPCLSCGEDLPFESNANRETCSARCRKRRSDQKRKRMQKPLQPPEI